MKLCTLHTTDKFVSLMSEPFTRPFLLQHPHLTHMDIADSSLIEDTKKADGVTAAVTRRMLLYMQAALEAKADGILVTCTSVNSATKYLRPLLPIPVMSIEEAAAEEAVMAGSRIGILSSLATSAEPVKQTIVEIADQRNVSLEVKMQVADGAFEALMSQDRALHDQLIQQTLADLIETVDVVIFAQISMALCDHPDYGKPVLKLGQSGYEAILRAMNGG